MRKAARAMNAHASHFRSVSLRLHRGRRNPQRRPAPLFCPHRRADRTPKHSADAWRMIQLGAADIGSRVPADPRAPPPSKYTPRSRPRALIRHNRRDTTTTRESRLQLARQRSPFDSDQTATVKSPLRIPVGGTSSRKTRSAHQSEAYHEKTNDHLQTSRNCL
jgi:hypothetical protein